MIFDDYQKIATIYERDPKIKALKKGEYYGPLANYLKYLENLIWIWTEKIDGTNTGINWDGHSISYQERTEAEDCNPFELSLSTVGVIKNSVPIIELSKIKLINSFIINKILL